ncbi:hypothetical protein JHK84_034178 [Glycine max]|nr:hypothetical protein JHK84_034178 [Glycine max]
MPLEGITVVADLDETKIVEYFDRKIAPVPKAEGTEYVASNQKSPFGPTFTGATFVQPNGLGFKINGHSISGEFGFGQSMVSLEPLADWPSNAAFLDAYFAGEDGVLVKTTNAFCVFQKYAGDIMWRHIESEIHDEEIREVRPNVSLVVRIVSMVGNYDCIIDWEFKPSGSIKIGELEKLVPGGLKMNTAEMLHFVATKYVKFLQAQVGMLELMNTFEFPNDVILPPRQKAKSIDPPLAYIVVLKKQRMVLPRVLSSDFTFLTMTVEVVAKKETQVAEVVVVVETQKEEKVAEENVEPRESSVEESKPKMEILHIAMLKRVQAPGLFILEDIKQNLKIPFTYHYKTLLWDQIHDEVDAINLCDIDECNE